MRFLLQFTLLFWLNTVQCTIDGLTYMDPLNIRKKENGFHKLEDMCNPLYWYPRHIPEYCYYKANEEINKPFPPPLPLPLPVPVPPNLPPWPVVPPINPPMPDFASYLIPTPLNQMFLAPGQPPTYLPSSHPSIYQTGYQPPRAGMVPGLPGLVTRDGGINIMPFSDVYTDVLEKHANKLTRRKIQNLLKKYRNYPRSRYARRLAKYARKLKRD